MKNFQTVVQELLHNHERQRRYIALLTALCMLMAFTVSIILIEPAESMTGELACGMSEHIHNENCFTYTCGQENDENHVHSAECRKLICEQTEHAHSENCYIHDDEQTAQIMQINSPEIFNNEQKEDITSISAPMVISNAPYFEQVQTVQPEKASPFRINDVTITVDGEEYKGGSTIDFSNRDVSLNSVDNIGFYITYQLKKGDVYATQPYIFYQLPEGITLPKDLYGGDMTVLIGDDVVGYYSISKDGLITIRFLDSYIDELNTLSDDASVDGFIKFTASIKRDSSAEGDRTLDFDGREFYIDFPTKDSYGIEKEGAVKPTQSSDDKSLSIEWKVTVNSYNDDYSLEGFTVEDNKFPLDGTGVTVVPAGYGHFVNNADEKSSYYVFDSDLPTGTNSACFSYFENIDWDTYRSDYGNNYNMSITNDAYLNASPGYSGTVKKWEAHDTVELNEKPTIEKFGTPDYNWDTPEYGKKVRWTITVTHPYGTSLEGYQIVDEAFRNAEDIKIVDQYGNDFTNYSHVTGSDTITVNEVSDGSENKSTANKLIITYVTTLDGNFNDGTANHTSDQMVTQNHATLKPPTSVTTVDKTDEVDSTVSYTNQQVMSPKTGNYDYFTRMIEWTVGASVKKIADGITLDGYTMTDDAFRNIDFTKLSTEDISVYFNNEKLTGTVSEKEITFSDGVSIKIEDNKLTVTGNIQSFTLNYRTDPTESGSDGTTRDTGNKNIIYNEVSDSWGRTGKGTANTTPRDYTKKYLTSTPENSEGYVNPDSEEPLTFTLPWKIELLRDNGFKDSPLTDTVTASVTGGSSHYINKNLTIKGSTDGKSYNDLETSDYTITWTPNESNPTSFTITFNKSVDDRNIHYVTIEYTSTATIDAPSSGKWSFEENGKKQFQFFNETEGNKPSWDYTVKDNTHIDMTSITVNKAWAKPDSIEIPEGDIEYYLERSTDGEKWERIYLNDNDKWVTDTEESHTYKLSASESWTKTWTDLPQENERHEKYQYMAVEVNVPEGYTASYSSPVTSGNYTITNVRNSDYRKVALDKNGLSLENGEKISIDDLIKTELSTDYADVVESEEYYLIPYKITYTGNSTDTIKIIDTLPDGFSLVYYNGYNKPSPYEYHVRQRYNSGEVYTIPSVDSVTGQQFHYDKEKNQVIFGCSSYSNELYYYIKISAKDLEEKVGKITDGKVINNSIQIEGQNPYDFSFNVTGSTQKPKKEDNSLLKKAVNNIENSDNKALLNANQGKIEYSVYVNPEGKDLSNNDEYDIVDVLSLSNWSGNNELSQQQLLEKLVAGEISVKVEYISDFSIDSKGNISAEVGTELPLDKYQFNVDYQPKTIMENYPLYFRCDGSAVKFYSVSSSDAYSGNVRLELDIQGTDKVKGKTLKFKLGDVEIEGTFDKQTGIMHCVLDVLSTSGSWNSNVSIENVNSSEYIKNFTVTSATATSQIIDSSAHLTLTVPDNTPLKVTYSYIVTNSEGKDLNGDTFTATNNVSLETDNVYAKDSQNNTFKVNINSSAGIEISDYPEVIKYNVGNAGEKLSAKFYLAVYSNGGWKYVIDYTKNAITEGSSGYSYTYTDTQLSSPVNGDGIDTNAKAIEIGGENDKIYKLQMEPKKLYKLIEIQVPNEDYEAYDTYISGLKSDSINSLDALLKAYLNSEDQEEFEEDNPEYCNILHKFIAVHYYKYTGDDLESKPSDYDKLNVTTVSRYGTISIPNNKLIDVSVSKIWADKNVPDDAEITVELYWSTTKSSTGIPTDATFAGADNLGMKELQNPITIKNSSGAEGEIVKAYTWNNLPNGKDDKPIYYYVKETAYKIDGTTYKLKDNGTFLSDENTKGEYDVSYTGDGVNRDTNEIEIRNAKGLWISKQWRNSDNSVMETDDIPVSEIKFRLYGTPIDGEKEKLLYTGVLTQPDWTMQIPESVDLTGYTTFEVEEIKDEVKLYGFSVDYNKNINGKTGELTIINKDTTPTTIKVKVNKKWLDNITGSHSEITVKLYRSTTRQTDNGLALSSDERNLVPDTEITLNDSNNWTHTWTNLAYRDEAKNRYYYYAVESPVPVGYEVSYDRKESSNLQTIDITNYLSGDLTLSKEWLNADNSKVEDTAGLPEISVELYRTTEDVETISGDFRLMSLDSATPPSNLKVYAMGDSITNGYWANKGDDSYPSQLKKKLTDAGYENVTVDNAGVSGLKIEEVMGDSAYPALDGSYDVVLLIAGTNNIIHTNDTVEEMINKIKLIISGIYAKNSNIVLFIGGVPTISYDKNHQAPKGNKNVNGDVNGRDGACYEDNNTDEAILKIYSDVISEYNKQLKSLPNEYSDKKIYYVDTYTAVGDKLDDGVHPDAEGYIAIANAFKEKIDMYYGLSSGNSGGTGTTPGDGNGEKVSGLPEDFFNSDGTVNAKYSLVSVNGQSVFKFGSGNNWTLTEELPQYDENGNEYHYYVRELTVNGYTTSYEGNGATANGENTIKITNKAEPVTGLELEKIWSKSGSTTASEDAEPKTPLDKIQVKIIKKLTPNNLDYSSDNNTSENENSSTTNKDFIEITSDKLNLNYDDNVSTDITELLNGKTVIKVTVIFENIGNINIAVQYNGEWNDCYETYNQMITETEFVVDMPIPSSFNKIRIANNWGGEKVKAVRLYTKPEVKPFYAELDRNNIVPGEYAQISTNRSVTYTFKENNPNDVISINNTGRITALKEGITTIVVTDTESKETKEITIIVISPIIKESIIVDFYRGIDGIWLPDTAMQEELKHLPMTDESGRKYLYYIEEIFEGDDTALQGYEKPKYFNDTRKLEEGEGVELTEGSLVSLKVVNTRKESSTTTMPSTGGTGAGKCYTVGGMLLMMSACGWAMHRRKRVIPH